MKVHFIGIFGSGCSGVAVVAKKLGFDVSGCDPQPASPYSNQVISSGIQVFQDFDNDSHFKDADIVAASPAFLEQKTPVAEVIAAKNAGKLMKWQDFLGKHILPTRRVVAVCGTHGKTTTSALVANILETAGLDPTAFIGAIVPQWNSSSRFGNSEWAVIEADEYANNFQSYRPEIVVLNNLEMEHPEYFRDFEHYKQTFRDFISHSKVVVYNQDDQNACELVANINAEKIPFSAHDFPGWTTQLLGAHNRSNIMAAATVARKLGIADNIIASAVAIFRPTGHRLQKIFESKSIVVFDDYAHHHTQVKNTIAAVREAYSDYKLLVVYEPHQISRYVQNTDETLAALSTADQSVIVAFHAGREAHLPMPDAAEDISMRGIENIRFIPNADQAMQFILSEVSGKTAILVMGAGQSYKISEHIVKLLENKNG